MPRPARAVPKQEPSLPRIAYAACTSVSAMARIFELRGYQYYVHLRVPNTRIADGQHEYRITSAGVFCVEKPKTLIDISASSEIPLVESRTYYADTSIMERGVYSATLMSGMFTRWKDYHVPELGPVRNIRDLM